MLVVVPDLFFLARILETARSLGVVAEESPAEHALERCRASAPDLVILDLHGPGDPLGLARALESDVATRNIPLVGFYSHVDQALREAALVAGVDRVMPRSAFTMKLAEILAGAGGD